jgi:hypothetical protein
MLIRAYERHVSKLFSRTNTNCWRAVMQQQVYRYMRHVKQIETYATIEVDY